MNTTTTKIAGEAMTDQDRFYEFVTELAEPFWLKDAQKDGEFFDANGFARALLASNGAVPADDVIDLAVALEQRRALHIVAAVRQQGFSKSGTAIPTQTESVFDLACEEIEHRLRTETWELAGVTGPLPTAPAQSCGDAEQADAPQAESHVVFITDRTQSIDDVLPQDHRWVISKAIGLVAGYRNCKASETKEAMQEFVDYLRSALADAAVPRASDAAEKDSK